jgi:hypothetical protein
MRPDAGPLEEITNPPADQARDITIGPIGLEGVPGVPQKRVGGREKLPQGRFLP